MFAFLLVSLLGSEPVVPAAPAPAAAPVVTPEAPAPPAAMSPVTPEAPAPPAPTTVTPEAPAPPASVAAEVPAAPVPVDAPFVKESEPVKEAVAEPVRETAPVTETFSVAQSRYIRRTNGEVVHCAAQQVLTGHPSRQGKWVINYVYTGDPYGFQALINNFRQRMGLRTLSYDPNLSNWAAQNNQAQLSRGMGHHVNPGFRQNAGWNYQNAQHVFQGWLGSPGHRDAMVAANVASFGIHYLNPYWTLNLR